MADVVTGDAVVLELPLARLASRALAFALDLLVMAVGWTVVVVALVAAGMDAAADPALGAAIGVLMVVSVFVIYPVAFETLSRGRSLGKMALGLRVVREDGGPIRFRHALSRGLTGFVVDFGVLSAFSGAIGLISSLLSARGRRVGDVLAGTVVVRERAPRAPTTAITMPPPLAGWAGTLALAPLPDALAQEARQFLLRAAALDPAVRVSLGASLGAAVAAHVQPPAPPGTPVEAYLAAVLAERRRRDEQRLAAQRAAMTPAPPTPPPTAAVPTQRTEPTNPGPTNPGPTRPVPVVPEPRSGEPAAPAAVPEGDHRPDPPDGGFTVPR